MLFDSLRLLILPLIRVKSIIFGLIIQVIIAEAMLKTWDYSFEVLDMVILLAQTLILVGHFLGIYKNVWDLLLHFCTDLNWYYSIALCFEEHFTLTPLEEADICNLEPKVYFMVHTW